MTSPNSVSIWDLRRGVCIKQLSIEQLSGTSTELYISPDGKMLAAIASARGGQVFGTGVKLSPMDSALTVYDIAAQRRIFRTTLRGRPCAVAFSGDGRWLLSKLPGAAGRLQMWDLSTKQEVGRFHDALFSAEFVTLSPNGAVVLTAGQTLLDMFDQRGQPALDQIRVWEFATGREMANFVGFRGRVRALTVSPDGCLLAAGTSDGLVMLWDLRSGEKRAALKGHQGPVTAVAFSGNGSLLAAGGADTTIFIWELDRIRMASCDAVPSFREPKLNDLWHQLAAVDPRCAFEASKKLVKRPNEALRLFKSFLPHIQPITAQDIARLVVALNDHRFAQRDRGTRELALLGPLARPALRRALRDHPSPEARRRLFGLLDSREGPGLSVDELRALRAIHILGLIGGQGCRALLTSLAANAADPRVRQMASAELAQMGER